MLRRRRRTRGGVARAGLPGQKFRDFRDVTLAYLTDRCAVHFRSMLLFARG